MSKVSEGLLSSVAQTLRILPLFAKTTPTALCAVLNGMCVWQSLQFCCCNSFLGVCWDGRGLGGYVDTVWDEKNTNATPNSCYANVETLKHQLKSYKWLYFLFLPFIIHRPLDFAFSFPVPLSFSSKLGSQLVLHCCAAQLVPSSMVESVINTNDRASKR